MLIKICGITNLEDAQRAVDLGAHALGFNFYPPSPRYIEPAAADRIIDQLPKSTLTVAIVVGRRLDNLGRVQAVQVHGLDDPSPLRGLRRRIFVATTPRLMGRFPNHEIVLDSSWGTGKKEDWSQLRHIKRDYILSGGLTPDNVGDAIQLLEPMGVDVCSGVESRPGRKDPIKLKRFIEAALTASGAQAPRRE